MCGAGGRIIGLVKADVTRVIDEEAGSEEGSNAVSVEV